MPHAFEADPAKKNGEFKDETPTGCMSKGGRLVEGAPTSGMGWAKGSSMGGGRPDKTYMPRALI